MKNSNIQKICTNCMLVDSNLISYETIVANVDHENKNINQLGYWSKTTQKHINKTAEVLGYNLLKPAK
jgi:hypothetical protein